MVPAELHLPHLLSLTSITPLRTQPFEPLLSTLQLLQPEKMAFLAREPVRGSAQLQGVLHLHPPLDPQTSG